VVEVMPEIDDGEHEPKPTKPGKKTKKIDKDKY
jgi:hypothetical protein